MKHWYLVLCIVFALNVSAQDRIDDKALLQMSIVEVLDSLQIPSAYKQRHEILLSLCHEGVIIFDGTLNPNGDDLPCYYYIGTAKQNAKFVRNIVANRHLFIDGRLRKDAREYWVIVE